MASITIRLNVVLISVIPKDKIEAITDYANTLSKTPLKKMNLLKILEVDPNGQI